MQVMRVALHLAKDVIYERDVAADGTTAFSRVEIASRYYRCDIPWRRL